MMDINNIELKEEYKNYIQRPSSEDYEGLKQSIIEYGIIFDLIINQHNVLIDGYTRIDIAKELDITDIPVDKRTFKDKLEEKSFIINSNKRRHFNNIQKAEMGLKILELEKEKAKQRQSQSGGDKKSDREIFPEPIKDKGRARDKAGKAVGLSGALIDKASKIKKYIDENDDEKGNEISRLWEEEKKGKGSVSKVFNAIKSLETKEQIAQERMDDEQRRFQNQGNRFLPEVEYSLTKQLGPPLINTPNPDETKAVAMDIITLSCDWFTIIAKTEEAKRVLSRFIHPDPKVKKMTGGDTYTLSHIEFAIKLMKKIDSSATLTIKKNKPLTIENEHFKFQVGGL